MLDFKDPDLYLRNFEPENPSLFVRRKVGLGWDLNIGAVAVKLGMIRPDDSLPDLAEYIPAECRKMLSWGPLTGLAINALLSARLLRHKKAVSKWSLGGKPKREANSKLMAAVYLGISALPIGLSALERRAPERQGGDVVLATEGIGMQALSTFALIATLRQAAEPKDRQPLAALALPVALFTPPAMLVGTVKAALLCVEKQLKEDK